MQHDHQQFFARFSEKIIIDGVPIAASSGASIAVINPATQQTIGSIVAGEVKDIDKAVQSAKIAQKKWAKFSTLERSKKIRECAVLLAEEQQLLAELMSYETGKAMRTESLVEASIIADSFEFFAGLASEIKGETIPYNENMLSMTVREPVGIVAAILPWNVPLMLMAMKVAPALVAGNAVVLKPSPEASFCVLYAAMLLNQILPAGLVNVITGAVATGELLTNHPEINKITFTGSVESGRAVYKAAAAKIVPVTLELGGKSPFIICADANIDKVVTSIYEGMRFTRQGQSCSAASRILVHDSIHDELVTKLLKLLDTKIIGDPFDPKTDIGTIISKRQYTKIQEFIDIAKQDSKLTVHSAGQLNLTENCRLGLFLRPTIITNITNDHQLCQQEIFGPVATIIKWHDFAEAINIANASEFGLAAAIWTNDISMAFEAARALEAGFVQVNQYMVFRPSLPFGGFKNSGIGKEASLASMIEHYTRCKTILINI